MGKWSDGVMEWWSDGVMEWWVCLKRRSAAVLSRSGCDYGTASGRFLRASPSVAAAAEDSRAPPSVIGYPPCLPTVAIRHSGTKLHWAVRR